MFRIKICGVTSVEDALLAAVAGADAIGLNFYPKSPRFVEVEQARQIVDSLPKSVRRVGVFVDASVDEIRRAVAELGLDLAQLHGDEPVELLRALRGVPVMKAFRAGADLVPIANYLASCHRGGCVPRMLLLDAARTGLYGGTGTTLDWQALAAGRPLLAGLPLVLAGGLTPLNVAEAIAAVRPWGVDVASGVEDRPGRKSKPLVEQFVAAAKLALADRSHSHLASRRPEDL